MSAGEHEIDPGSRTSFTGRGAVRGNHLEGVISLKGVPHEAGCKCGGLPTLDGGRFKEGRDGQAALSALAVRG